MEVVACVNHTTERLSVFLKDFTAEYAEGAEGKREKKSLTTEDTEITEGKDEKKPFTAEDAEGGEEGEKKSFTAEDAEGAERKAREKRGLL